MSERKAQHIGQNDPPDIKVDAEVVVVPARRQVKLAFSAKIDNLNSTPEQAVAIAKAMLDGAKRLDPKTVEGITWQTTH